MKKIISTFILAITMFAACNSQSNEPIKVKSEEMDTVALYDIHGNYMKDTLIPKEILTK